ncbi:MAG TPA: hypothetical protein PLG59_07765 [bacterium]|nr:hypothetical protein [bacterium]
MRFSTVALSSMILLVGTVHFAGLSDALGVSSPAQYAADCEGRIFWEPPSNERILEILIEGESIGNVSLFLPALYDTSLRALVRINDHYVGTRCVLTRKDEKEVGIKMDVFLTYEDKPGEHSLATLNIYDRVLIPGVPQRFVGVPTAPVQPEKELTEEYLATLKWHYHLTATIREPLLPPAAVPLKEAK